MKTISSAVSLARRAGARAFAAGFLILAVAWQPAGAQDFMSAKEPGAFIDELGAAAIQHLTDKTINSEERRSRFRDLMHKAFNVPGIGRFVLGRYWNQATEEERQEYMRLFEELVVRTYADRFSEYSGEKFAVGKVQRDAERANYATVLTTISRPNGQSVRVDWRVRQEEDQSWRVVDIVIEGVSMSVTQRSEFASVIESKGGTVKGLIDTLRQKVQGA
ncbi:MAG TPA: ABC transporter substrate-binding protein [Alphaproteobacteria bacterium]|nr:ABC transporter substrate-binding protein [Alphaproteobacteria bacterium]